MAASVQYRRQERGLGMMMKEKDDDLELFLEMRDCEKDKNNLLFENSDEFDQLGPKPDTSQISKVPSTLTACKTDDFLSSENDKTDYNWLLTPPATPLFPLLEMESQKTVMSHQLGISNAQPTTRKSGSVLQQSNPMAEQAPENSITSRQPSLFSTTNSSSSAGNRRSSPSGGLGSTTSRPTVPSTAKASRSSTPTPRSTLSSVKPKPPSIRSSTPTSSTPRSSTPTLKSSIASSSKPTSRSGTPTPRSSTPSSIPRRTSAPPGRSSSATKSHATSAKSSVPSRGTSPTVKSRPLNPSESAPQNLRASMPKRPSSASRVRSGVPISNGGQGRKSCSPSRGRGPHGGSSVPAMTRARPNNNDDVNPVLIGTKMVERVVNMRKLAPPKHDDNLSGHNNSSGKSSLSQDNSGFGRTLSKKSLDMAMRHMDIRRSIPGNLRPRLTNIPASSVYSVRSGSIKTRTVSVSDSPLATSSNASSEPSVKNNSYSLDGTEEDDNEL